MSSHPWVKWYPSDFLNGVVDMTPHEIAVYTVVLNRMYDENGPIPDDPKRIARRCNMRLPQCEKAIQGLIDADKLTRQNGLLINSRTQKELEKRHERSKKQASNAHVRWQKDPKKTSKNNEGVMPAHISGNAKCMPTRSQKLELDTVSKDTDAAASASKAVDPKKLVYDEGKSLLKAYGIANGTAGGLITKWLKSHDPPELISAFMEARRAERHDIVEYVVGVLKNGKANETEPIDREAFLARYRARHEG